MLKLEMNGKAYNMPENWQEVIKADKYLPLMAVLHFPFNSQKTKHLALLALTGIPGKEFSDNIMVATQLLDEVYPLMDFIFRGEVFTECPIPSFLEGLEYYYAPADKLLNQSAGEMEECGWAYSEYVKTGDEKFLDHLIAALYLPETDGNGLTVNGVAKRHFNKYLVPARAERFARLTAPYKYGILLWYENCERWWGEQNSNLYSKPVAEEKESIDSLAYSKLIRRLAGPKRGTVEEIRKTMLRDEIFFELQQLESEREALEL